MGRGIDTRGSIKDFLVEVAVTEAADIDTRGTPVDVIAIAGQALVSRIIGVGVGLNGLRQAFFDILDTGIGPVGIVSNGVMGAGAVVPTVDSEEGLIIVLMSGDLL